MLAGSISKNSLLLGAFALVTTALLALTAELTQQPIAKAEREAQQKALFEIVPRAHHDNDMLVDTIAVPAEAWAGLGLKSGGDIQVARHLDETIAVIIPAVAPDGYSGDIRMLVGINADGSIAGVRVIDHHETPGLGDKIELKKDSWILAFNGKSIQSPEPEHWKVRKDGGDFDQFAGATITPRAIVNQVRKVLEFVDSHRDELFQKKASPDSKPASP
ncbi:MAG TPA: electron transport complex subunit RsxG [Cellvibrio sp.]|nr:electron transport complex subunit RsxG [Cellvibrio sp.]